MFSSIDTKFLVTYSTVISRDMSNGKGIEELRSYQLYTITVACCRVQQLTGRWDVEYGSIGREQLGYFRTKRTNTGRFLLFTVGTSTNSMIPIDPVIGQGPRYRYRYITS